MAFNQGKLLQGLETLVSKGNKEDFIYNFFELYGIPKATITRLKSGTDTRNIGVDGDIGLKKKAYFRASNTPVTLDQLDSLCASDVVELNDIRFVILTDFDKVLANDLIAEEVLDISFAELAKNYHFFLPITGQYEKAIVHSEHPADLKASEKMGQLFDLIRERNRLESKEDIHALNVFLTRLLFCFYAEDTDIFQKGMMTETMKSVTKEDGSDLDEFFSGLFAVLNLPGNDNVRASLPAHFNKFPYVNGGLFETDEPIPEFGPKSRRILIECSALNWSEINPDIFGSMFQVVIDPAKRGELGQHYTSVPNIMKVIKPLFLDGLYEELEASRNSKSKLQNLLGRLQKIKVFDPACGSGNFLIIAYKELRRFEMEVFKALNAISGQNVFFMSCIQLSQFYGIEIDDFAHEIAILSLWLAEHQMNKLFAQTFGHAEPMLPLKEAGNVVYANSLQIDWNSVCPKENGFTTYIIGNPPFLGSGGRTDDQNADMLQVFAGFQKYKTLDLVASWFWKASQYANDGDIEFAFVTTNSICQGDQVSVLWPPIFKLGFEIKFAYETFSWKSNAKGAAAVHVVILGISKNPKTKTLFTCSDQVTFAKSVSNISPYLVEGPSVWVTPSDSQPEGVSKITKGSQATDGGNLFITPEDKHIFEKNYPETMDLIRPVLGADEFLNGLQRFCFWLKNKNINDLVKIPELAHRLKRVETMRLQSKKAQTREMALRPHLFSEIRQPEEGNYLLVPRVSSERRIYVPLGFFSHEVICSDANLMVPNAALYDFGILTSMMHNDWMRCVAGRLKSDYRYSATLVYNTFPWPKVSEKQKAQIEYLAEAVLLAREDYPEMTLAQLYDPEKMPAGLHKAHQELDLAVDSLYRKKLFKDSSDRLSLLFDIYQKLTVGQTHNDEAIAGESDE